MHEERLQNFNLCALCSKREGIELEFGLIGFKQQKICYMQDKFYTLTFGEKELGSMNG